MTIEVKRRAMETPRFIKKTFGELSIGDLYWEEKPVLILNPKLVSYPIRTGGAVRIKLTRGTRKIWGNNVWVVEQPKVVIDDSEYFNDRLLSVVDRLR